MATTTNANSHAGKLRGTRCGGDTLPPPDYCTARCTTVDRCITAHYRNTGYGRILLPGLPGDTSGLPGILPGTQNPQQPAGVEQALFQVKHARVARSAGLPQCRKLTVAQMTSLPRHSQ